MGKQNLAAILFSCLLMGGNLVFGALANNGGFVDQDWSENKDLYMVPSAGGSPELVGFNSVAGTGGVAPAVGGGELTVSMEGATTNYARIDTGNLEAYDFAGSTNYVVTTRVKVTQFPDLDFSGSGIAGIVLFTISGMDRTSVHLDPDGVWVETGFNAWTKVSSITTEENTYYTWQFEVRQEPGSQALGGTMDIYRRASDSDAWSTVATNVDIYGYGAFAPQFRMFQIGYNPDNTQIQGSVASDYLKIGTDSEWTPVIGYTPDSGLVYSLLNNKDGRVIPVLLGVRGGRKVVVGDVRTSISIPSFSDDGSGNYAYQFGNYYSGTTHLSANGTWEISLTRTLSAQTDLKFEWWDNYINSHLIAGRYFLDEPNPPTLISEEGVPVSEMFHILPNSTYSRMGFDSAIGRIDITFSRALALVDHRLAPWRKQDDAHLFYNNYLVDNGASIQLDMHITITPDLNALGSYEPAPANEDIYTPREPIASRHIVVPAPKQISWGTGCFDLGSRGKLFHRLANGDIPRHAISFFDEAFQINLNERALPETQTNCLVLVNDELPEGYGQELDQMQGLAGALESPEGYVLRVVDGAVLIVGKTEAGVWTGLMSLFQLSRHQVSETGIRYDFVEIVDHPSFGQRGFYVRMQPNVDWVWQRSYIRAMAELKYNQAYLHFSSGIGVALAAQPGCYDSRSGRINLSTEEFAELVQYIRSFNMEVIPIWATGKTQLPIDHLNNYPDLLAMTIEDGKYWDISLDSVVAYHKSLIDEILELTGASTIHLGLDEIYNFTEYTDDTSGRGDLILSDYINAFTDEYAPRGIHTVVYHDMLINSADVDNPSNAYFTANATGGSEGALDLLSNRDMLSIDDWNYSENTIYPDFDYFHNKGFDVYGSCWYRYGNVMGFPAYVTNRTDTFICTYWSTPGLDRLRNWDPRGSRKLQDAYPTYKFLPAIGLAAESAWNAGNRSLSYDFMEETLRLFNQRPGRFVRSGEYWMADLSAWVNRDLVDVFPGDGEGFIDLGRRFDLRDLPAGQQVFGGIPFLVSSNQAGEARAVSVAGGFTPGLPVRVSVPMQTNCFSSLVFLHACHYDFEENSMNKDLKTQYIVAYEDGATQTVNLFNDGNIMAWAPGLTRFDAKEDALWLAWEGLTVDNLPCSVFGYTWKNPYPEKAILSVALQSDPSPDSSVFLIALTGIQSPLNVLASESIRGADGAVLPGNSTSPGALVQLVDAGPDGVWNLPDAAGNPSGDDTLFASFHIGEGMPEKLMLSGRLSVVLDPPPAPGHILYARAFDAETLSVSSHWGQSAPFVPEQLVSVDLSALGLTATTLPLGTDPLATDTDGDGQSDYEELIANTDAGNPDDVFIVWNMATDVQPLEIQLEAFGGREYILLRSTNDLSGPMVWDPVDSSGVRTENRALVLRDFAPPESDKAFYKVIVTMP